MDRSTTIAPGMSTKAIYRIVVKGRLSENWAEWFNGSSITIESDPNGKTNTILTCNVRDQAELFGILNQLNNLNLPLFHVSYINNY
jgi:hypothetical protein